MNGRILAVSFMSVPFRDSVSARKLFIQSAPITVVFDPVGKRAPVTLLYNALEVHQVRIDWCIKRPLRLADPSPPPVPRQLYTVSARGHDLGFRPRFKVLLLLLREIQRRPENR